MNDVPETPRTKAMRSQVEELLVALKALVEWAKVAEVSIDGEWGVNRSRDQMEAENAGDKEILDAVAAIDKAETTQ